ncbi:MAG: FAD-dependent thymidylate synthase [Candidatus Wallbacteria bacterium]|nr:FAD-dependent thymidylate synthase [Candidatus Wallbacteria bacterium]
MLKVVLLSYTPAPEEIISKAAKLCYSPKNITELEVTPADQKRMVRKMFSLGHHSTLEHAAFTFGIEGISRACSHQLVRHRMASYSQQSQRYVRFDQPFEFVTPDTVRKNRKASAAYRKIMKSLHEAYRAMIEEGIPAEDARYLLPNACTTKLIMTMNARELLHFFNLRLCSRAQKEIRDVAAAMLSQVRKVTPHIFEKAGPTCISYGYCREEAKDCPLYSRLNKKPSTAGL